MEGLKSKYSRVRNAFRELRLSVRNRAADGKKEPQLSLESDFDATSGPWSNWPLAISESQVESESELPGGKKVSFMDLPGELRNRIYSLVIPKEKDADYLIALNGPRHIAQTVLKSSIFKLNKQIRFESMSYKFADQNFTFSDVKIMTNFLRWVGKPGRALLTRMTLIGLLCDGLEGYDVEIPEIDASLPFMLQATGLKKFQLIVRADYNEITRKPNLFVHPDKKWNCFLRLRETVESIGAEFHWEFYSNSNDGNGSLIPIRLHRHVLVDVDLSRDMNLGYEILDGTEVVGVPVARPPGYPIRIMD